LSTHDSCYQSLLWEILVVSSVTNAGNPQQGGKKDKDKNKDIMVLVEESLIEINAIMSILTGRVEDMDKRIKELESKGDKEEPREEMRAVVNSVVVDVLIRIQILRASKATEHAKLQAFRPEIEVYKVRVEALEAQIKVHGRGNQWWISPSVHHSEGEHIKASWLR